MTKQFFTSAEDASLVNKFAQIVEFTDKYSAVQVNTGTKKEVVHYIFSKFMKTVEQLAENKETEFLIVPVIEHYFNLIRPAIVIPYEDIVAGNTQRLELCKNLEEELQNHPVRQMWKQSAEEFRKIAETAGYTFDKTDYRDLATIAPIIANAITALNTYNGKQRYQVRRGKRSGKNPVMMDDVSIFQSVAQAVELYEKYAPQSFIGFFGVQQTYGDTNHNFDEWLYGHSSRKNNIMYYEKISAEEYKKTLDINSRKMYCMIRDGENIWIVQPPIYQSGIECLNGKPTFINFYGSRASYAPIQIFWDEAPATSDNASIVPYKQRKWSLRQILDEEQKVWLPIYFSVLRSYFFDESTEPEAHTAVIAQETQITLELTNGTKSNLPSLVRNEIKLLSPEELFSKEKPIDGSRIDTNSCDYIKYKNALTMIKWLDIVPDDISDAPFEFKELMSVEQAQDELNKQTVRAYYKVIQKRLEERWNDAAYSAQEWYHTWVYNNIDNIIARSNNKEINFSFTEDKIPLFNKDGSPQMKRYGYQGKYVQSYLHTSMDDGKQLRLYGDKPLHEYRDWFPCTLMDKHPPTVFKILPEHPEDIAKLTNVQTEDLPEGIRYMDIAIAFMGKYYRNGMHPGFNGNITLIFSKTEAKRRKLINKE